MRVSTGSDKIPCGANSTITLRKDPCGRGPTKSEVSQGAPRIHSAIHDHA